jgi:hypothetical protein
VTAIPSARRAQYKFTSAIDNVVTDLMNNLTERDEDHQGWTDDELRADAVERIVEVAAN